MQEGLLTLDHCDNMDGSVAMEGWSALAVEGLYFNDFLHLNLVP